MKKVMMLGAGRCQVNAIKKINELGHISIASDNSLTSIGKKYAKIGVLADTFSYEESHNQAVKYGVDAVMTSGTDQPVLTVARLAGKLGLPSFLSSEIALLVTNKKYMKEMFKDNNIATSDYALVDENFHDEDLNHLKAPYVIKPLDSQGQRGIFKVDNIGEIRKYFKEVISFSREKEIIVESYYKNKEITVSGWLDKGECKILTVTDRATFSSDEHIGVCISHEYPSIHLEKYREEIFQITHKICRVFAIKEGPIYFQYLVGDRGILVNEIACRLGGAFEDITIPYATGVDVLKMNIEGALDKEYDKKDLGKYIYEEKKCFSTQLFFCKAGQIVEMTPLSEILGLDFVLGADYNYSPGQCIGKTQNASQRAGYVIISGESEEGLRRNIDEVFDRMKFINELGENLIIPGKRNYR